MTLGLRRSGGADERADSASGGLVVAMGRRVAVSDSAGCDARIINLETSITTSDEYAEGKAVHYRMNPANVPALTAIRPDVCVLANNHVLDFGRSGLLETLDVLPRLGFEARVRDGPRARGPVARYRRNPKDRRTSVDLRLW